MSKQPDNTNFVFDAQLYCKAMIKHIIHAEVPFAASCADYLVTKKLLAVQIIL